MYIYIYIYYYMNEKKEKKNIYIYMYIFLAVQRKESGAWLTAMTASSLGLRMEDEAVRVTVGLRLGLPLCIPHPCTGCGVHVDSSGTHRLGCRKSAGRHPRHAALKTLLRELWQQQTFHLCWSQWVSADRMASDQMVSQ